MTPAMTRNRRAMLWNLAIISLISIVIGLFYILRHKHSASDQLNDVLYNEEGMHHPLVKINQQVHSPGKINEELHPPYKTNEQMHLPDKTNQELRPPDIPPAPQIAQPQTSIHFRDLFNENFASQAANMGPDNVSDIGKYFIYRCDSFSTNHGSCGGLADRMKGMIAAYLIANLTGRTFKIENIVPSCDWRKFITPNRVNWSMPVPIHKTLPKNTPAVTQWSVIDNVAFFKSVNNLDLSSVKAMKSTYVYFTSNLDYMAQFGKSVRYKKQLAWMDGLTGDQIDAALYKRLFKPTPLIQSKVSQFLTTHVKPEEKLVCIHLRKGRSPSNPRDSVMRMRDEDLPRIWKGLADITKDVGPHKIFLMSDSDGIVADAHRQPFKDKLFTNPGTVVHTEKSRGIPPEVLCDGMQNVIVQQFVLMHCDVLVISKSGLSRMAAYVRGSDQDLHCILEKDGRIVPCKRSKFQQLYKVLG